MEELFNQIKSKMILKQDTWQKEVFRSQQYQQELKNLEDITNDCILTLQSITIYSRRDRIIYDNF
ncbi:hypothetical protein [Malaciobacter marinus]|uniref:hypothetical protein n=1 Tax=Malaciobacter marinus TaxID=505249 RepID=UPI003B005E68